MANFNSIWKCVWVLLFFCCAVTWFVIVTSTVECGISLFGGE